MKIIGGLLAVALLTGCLTAEKQGGENAFMGGDGVGNPGGINDQDTVSGPDGSTPTTGKDAKSPSDTTGTPPKDTTTPKDTATPVNDTGSGPTDTGKPPADVPGDPDSGNPEDTAKPPEDVQTGCPTFEITSFGLAGNPGWLHFGEAASLETSISSGAGAAPQVTVDVSPASMKPLFTDLGNGEGTFEQTDVDETFATTEVTFTLTVSDGGCSKQRTAKVKLLGNVWATEIGSDVVEVFRSDGTYLIQGIPSTFFSVQMGSGDPWSLLELAPDRIAVGSRHQSGVEVFDLTGEHLYSFDTQDDKGAYLYSVYGAYSMIRHQPDGKIWVGGPSEKILVYTDDGKYQETLHLGTYGPSAEGLVQLDNGKTVLVDDSSMSWDLYVLDDKGELIGGYGDNKNDLDVFIYNGARTNSGGLVFSGRNSPTQSGYLALLKPAGQLSKHSAPIKDFMPEYGIIPFGEGYLVATSKSSTNDRPLAYFDKDLNLVAEEWSNKEATYRGLMILGGN